MLFGRRAGVRLTAMAALAGVSSLTLSACGSGTAAPAVAATLATMSTPADPLASLSGAQVLSKALADLKSASTVRMTGSFSDSSGKTSLDLGFKPGRGCSGTIATDKGGFKLLVIGKTVYLNPDDTFWKANAGADAATVIGVIRGRYIKGLTSDKDLASLASLCDLSKQIGSVTGSRIVSKGKVITLDGARVLPMRDLSGGVVDVTDTSRPELVTISVPKDSTDPATKLTFSVGAPVTLTAPSASQVIDASQVGM
jgi:hypothetical protein